ncbi:PrsW family intramembrane metalloprotease [Schumannella soli]|uniref:PrsW family intramembrane metalloprotease n=2 Tax=Schumannella soli TaxID=2590779 RepID=A0A506XUV2_9MICO|nr:PrsW family intramembrane metalloprotease [Schumannella soli]
MQHAAPVFASPPPQPHVGRRVALIIGIVVAALAALLALAYTLIALGVASIFAAVLALIPLTVVLLAIRWVDRWEPEPLGIKIFAFLWGAGVAVVTALVVGVGVQVAQAFSGSDPTSDANQFFGAVIQAPIVEEGAKGLGILLIFLIGRKYFDGPVDGIVYGATIAAGFAFTENILYFGQQIQTSGVVSGEVVTIFFLRGVLSPFAHVMFTSMTGLALGLAASRFKHWAPSVGFYFVGLLAAMLLHGIWNAAASLVPGGIPGYLLYYCVVEVPLFVGLLVIVFWLRRRESRQTLARLAEYAAAGWINRDEVVALGSPAGRRQARAWAASRGQKPLMARYIRDATMLAAARQRVIRDTGRAEAQSDELVLLGKVTASRRALLGVGA